MKRSFNFVFALFLISGFIVAASTPVLAQVGNKMFYRYTTNDGRKVVSQTIPPQFVRNGYELLTISGEIVKVVPPAPPEADAERIANERKAAKEQARRDVELRRTYSSVLDIDSAKTRNLQELQNTINILQANLSSVKSQLKAQEVHAASVERSGKTLSNDILKNISTLRTEEKELNIQIKQREAEYQKSADRYEHDKLRFVEISKPKQ
ncbi:MAG TPA: hypothetical protein PK002_01700 [Cellvibrio sp.]|nr:hypothetical protein [Cellvibrio sp.]